MKNQGLRFRAPIQIRGINPYVHVSAEQAAQLKPDWRRPMPVRVQVDGKPDEPWRINMMPTGDGGFFLYLSGVVRDASNTGVGDVVTVEVAFDEDYRGGPADPMPPAFAEGLARDPAARRAWDALAPSRRKEVLRYLANLKSAEARQRNIDKALGALSGTRTRFMARDWNAAEDG